MSSFIDRVVGVSHFIGDGAPRNSPIVAPKPRTVNPWRRNGQALVARMTASADIKTSVERAIALLGQMGQAVSRGDKVLVKPNFNSPDPYPASTDPLFLRAVLELLLEAGARVIIGESAGAIWRPTRNVFQKLGIYDLVHDLDVKLVAFEDKAND